MSGLLPTKIHQNILSNEFEPTIRIGNQVPDGAVNLAYFKNPQSNLESSVLVSDAPKRTINHEQVTHAFQKRGMLQPDDNLFDPYISYRNEAGYAGLLKRHSVDWKPNVTEDRQPFVVTQNFITETEDIPEAILHQENGYVGTLLLQSKVLKPKTTEEVTEEHHQLKPSSRLLEVRDLTEPTYDFPPYYLENESEEIFEEGYEGKLPLEEDSIRYTKVSGETLGETVTCVKVFQTPEDVLESFEEDGVLYQLKATENVVGSSRYYAFTRYYGRFYGANDDDGIYGKQTNLKPYDQENKYTTTEEGYPAWGRGHFTERAPRIKEGIHRASSFEPLVNDVMPAYENFKYEQAIQGNTLMLDLTYSSTGFMWADQWDKNKPFPPEDYRPLDQEETLTFEDSRTPDLKKVNRGAFNDPQGRPAYYLPTASPQETIGQDQWFRDVIVFYKDDAVRTKAYYVGYSTTGETCKYKASAKYSGVLKKTEVVTTNKVTSWDCEATYAGFGVIQSNTFNGTALYQGLISKQLASGNLEPTLTSNQWMVANDKGILETVATTNTQRQSALESEHFEITPYVKNGTPLLYRGRLTYPIFHQEELGPYEFYSGTAVRLVNASNRPLRKNKVYAIKLEKVKGQKDLYWVDVYTSFVIQRNSPIYAIYHAFDLKGSGVSRVKTEEKEALQVSPFFFIRQDYNVTPSSATPGAYEIHLNDFESVIDTRAYPIVSYRIVGLKTGLQSFPASTIVLNRKYALSNELSKFNGTKYNISPLDRSGQPLTPYEVILKDNPSLTEKQKEELKKDLFKIQKIEEAPIEGQEADVILHIQPNGQGIIEAETTQETGFLNPETGKTDRILKIDQDYESYQGFIRPLYYVNRLDQREIKLAPPKETGALENWYPRLRYGKFTNLSSHLGGILTRYTYSIPEYHRQMYSSTKGKPFIDIQKEKVKRIGERLLQTSHYPLVLFRDAEHQLTSLKVYKLLADGTPKELTIQSCSFSEGIIELASEISHNDAVYVDYTYEEDHVVYRGYRDLNTFYDLDLNPNMYHTFLDPVTKKRQQVYDLFNSVVYLFLRPSKIEQLDDNGNPKEEATFTQEEVVYHQIDQPIPANPEDLSIGSIYVRHYTSLQSTTLVDTRVLGGGLLESIKDDLRHQLEPESDYYFDIGFYDGKPYPENGVVIVRLDRRLLLENGGTFTEAQVEEAVNRWKAEGILTLIEYVTTYLPEELPNESLEVDSSIVEQNKEPLYLYAQAQQVHQIINSKERE